MKNFYLFIFSLLLYGNLISMAQTSDESKFGIKFSGFIKTDLLYDSRQNEAFREGHFLLYPKETVKDKNNEDVNDKDRFNIMSIQTRLIGNITGPDAFGAKTSGLLECEFFGTSDADLNGFRIRHAILTLDWDWLSLMAGQYWHPMFVTDVFPGTLGFNTGAPFQPFTRNPQVRFTLKSGGLKVMAAAISQRDFQSMGPGPQATPNQASSSYLINAVIPNLHLQVQYKTGNNVFGAGADMKSIMPRTVTNKNYITDEKLTTYAALAYMKLDLDPITFKLEGIFGQNLSDMLMLGGYAVKTYDTTYGYETYTPQGCYSVWCDISTGKEFEFGLFGGYSQNLGTSDNFVPSSLLYARGGTIASLMRISPRFFWNSGKTRFATEIEYTNAEYGTPNALDKGKIEKTYKVSNIRANFAFYYFF